MQSIEGLTWDSNFFDLKIGRVSIDTIANFNFQLFRSQASKFDLVYIFAKEEIKDTSFILVDKKTVFYQEIVEPTKRQACKLEIRPFKQEIDSLEELVLLALESGVYSRFYLDKNFKNHAYARLYSEWILNSVNGKLAFEILVAIKNDEILGVITVGQKDEHLADIGLLAVSKNARGLGIGTALIYRSFEEIKKRGFRSVQVVTQLDNLPAVNLYKKANFVIKDITNVYHYWTS